MLQPDEILVGNKIIVDSEFIPMVHKNWKESLLRKQDVEKLDFFYKSVAYEKDYGKMMEIIDNIESAGYWVTITGAFVTIGLLGSVETLITIHPQGNTKKESMWKAIINLITYHQNINKNKI